VLLDDNKVNNSASSFTTGEPAVGARLVPVMVICCATEFTIALTTTGV
jgi:hypothetical protein